MIFNNNVIFNINESDIILGLTETGIIAYQRQSRKNGSSGPASPNVQLKVTFLQISSQERVLGSNIFGEICCLSPYMMINEKFDGFNS